MRLCISVERTANMRRHHRSRPFAVAAIKCHNQLFMLIMGSPQIFEVILLCGSQHDWLLGNLREHARYSRRTGRFHDNGMELAVMVEELWNIGL